MTLDEFHESLPDELKIAPGELPPAIEEAFRYLNDRNAAIDAGTPVADAPTFGEWRAVTRG